MNFTSPAFLWALPLAAAPLVLHFLSLKRARLVPFGDLSLLRQVRAKAWPRARLRSWLLIAARCLALAFLILSYSGPVLPSPGGSAFAGDEGLDVLLMLDASYSMGQSLYGKSRFEAARQAGRDLLRALRPHDRVSVEIFHERPAASAPPAWMSRVQALEALSRARLSHLGTDYAAALEAARELLKPERGRRRVLVFLSDGARHGFKDGSLRDGESDPSLLWLGLAWPPSPGNAYLASASLGGEAVSPAVEAAARASGEVSAENAVSAWLGEAKVASRAMRFSAGAARASLPLPRSSSSSGRQSWAGRLSLAPDSLRADDDFFFSFERAARRRVLCLYGDPGFLKAPRGGYFLKEILGGSSEGLLDYAVDFAELSRLAEIRLADYQAVLVADFSELSPVSGALLERYARQGGGLAVLSPSRAKDDAFRLIEPWLPARVGLVVPSWDPQGLAGEAAAAWKGFDLKRVSVWKYRKLEPRPSSRILAAAASGDPLLVEGRHGAGRVALWASSLDTGWTNLALKGFFAAWLDAVVKALAPARGPELEARNVKVGGPLEKFWGPEEPAPAAARVRSPDGRSALAGIKDRRLRYEDTDMPGLYKVKEDGGLGREWVYAVNVDRSRESDLTPVQSPPWKGLRLGALSEDFALAVHGRNARAWMLAAAAAMIMVEMALSLPPAAAAVLLFLALAAAPAQAQEGNRLAWTQIKLGPDWDPYPGAHADVLSWLSELTSVLISPQPRFIALDDPRLFFSPIAVLASRGQAPPPLSAEQARRLRDYLSAGGLLWIEDASGSPSSSFDRWVRKTLPELLPDSGLEALEPGHVLYKTFFLLRGPAGRTAVRGSLEGMRWGPRLAVIYSRNDILGAWARDAMGRPLLPCVPGGEPQRHQAKKLSLNILMYALTGNYKADAVHQPFLRMKSGTPP